MINLLPSGKKAELAAGKVNTILVRYLIMGGFGILLVAVVCGATFYSLSVASKNADERIVANKESYATYTAVKNAGDSFRKNLATAKQILDKQISYSKLLYKIAAIVPDGAVLDTLSLDAASFGSQATLEASATSYTNAVKVKDALQADKELFTDVSFQTVSQDTSSEETQRYPIKILLNVKINKEAL